MSDNNHLSIIPKVYSNDLQECLQVFEDIKYDSFGFPMVFLDYQPVFKFWSMSFRNPSNFSDPDIKAKTPLEAVHKMFDFLKTLNKI